MTGCLQAVFYAEVELQYDAAIAQESNGRPFGITNIRPIQLSQRNVMDILFKGEKLYA
jgi:ATP-dependent Lon protease